MKIIVKSNHATAQFNKDAMFYVGKFVHDGKLMFKGVNLGDFLAQGFGWFRLTSDKLNSAVLLLQSCIRLYRKHRDAELRARAAMAEGASVIAVSHTDAPFVQYTLAPSIMIKPKPVRRIQESAARMTLLGMRATSTQLAALVTKFAKA